MCNCCLKDHAASLSIGLARRGGTSRLATGTKGQRCRLVQRHLQLLHLLRYEMLDHFGWRRLHVTRKFMHAL